MVLRMNLGDFSSVHFHRVNRATRVVAIATVGLTVLLAGCASTPAKTVPPKATTTTTTVPPTTTTTVPPTTTTVPPTTTTVAPTTTTTTYYSPPSTYYTPSPNPTCAPPC
jgi:hypothetical protein